MNETKERPILDHAELANGEYFVQITHADPRFGVEHHYGDREKMLGFLNGRYANSMPGDVVSVRLAPDHGKGPQLEELPPSVTDEEVRQAVRVYRGVDHNEWIGGIQSAAFWETLMRRVLTDFLKRRTLSAGRVGRTEAYHEAYRVEEDFAASDGPITPFQWTCPRCGASNPNTSPHCPCEYENAPTEDHGDRTPRRQATSSEGGK